jgi:ligand-binding SRPBCC domain-containing protein
MILLATPTHTHSYQKRSVFRTTLEQLEAFHRNPSALKKLTPPPIFIQVHADHRTSLTSGDLDFTLWFGPLPVRWLARHESLAGPGFAEWQVKGPMAFWRHEHGFEEVSGGVALIDRVTLAHKPGIKGLLTRLIFDGIPLRILFMYRHWRTRQAVEKL